MAFLNYAIDLLARYPSGSPRIEYLADPQGRGGEGNDGIKEFAGKVITGGFGGFKKGENIQLPGEKSESQAPFANGTPGAFLTIPPASDIFRERSKEPGSGEYFSGGKLRIGPSLPEEVQRVWIPGGTNEFKLPKMFGGGEYEINVVPKTDEDPITHKRKKGFDIYFEGK